MGMSDRIESFILELMKQEREDWLRIQRNELAQIFGCVPSQINYVLRTRFSPEQGYIVDSRRGGGGCVKIKRIAQDGPSAVYISRTVTNKQAQEFIERLAAWGSISGVQAQILSAAVSDEALVNANDRDLVRADILRKCMEVT